MGQKRLEVLTGLSRSARLSDISFESFGGSARAREDDARRMRCPKNGVRQPQTASGNFSQSVIVEGALAIKDLTKSNIGCSIFASLGLTYGGGLMALFIALKEAKILSTPFQSTDISSILV